MTPAELAKIGRALYGERWQTPLARMLSIADRSVRRWLAGESAVPAGVADEIEELLARDRAHQALNHLIELQSEMGRPTEIRLTQGRDAVGRRATKIIATALREIGIAVEIVDVGESGTPTERATKSALKR